MGLHVILFNCQLSGNFGRQKFQINVKFVNIFWKSVKLLVAGIKIHGAIILGQKWMGKFSFLPAAHPNPKWSWVQTKCKSNWNLDHRFARPGHNYIISLHPCKTYHTAGVALTPRNGVQHSPKTGLHPPDMALWWVRGCIDITDFGVIPDLWVLIIPIIMVLNK